MAPIFSSDGAKIHHRSAQKKQKSNFITRSKYEWHVFNVTNLQHLALKPPTSLPYCPSALCKTFGTHALFLHAIVTFVFYNKMICVGNLTLEKCIFQYINTIRWRTPNSFIVYKVPIHLMNAPQSPWQHMADEGERGTKNSACTSSKQENKQPICTKHNGRMMNAMVVRFCFWAGWNISASWGLK